MIGQEKLRNTFMKMFENNNIPKLNILVGEKGMGKKEFIKWLSQETSTPYKIISSDKALGVDDIKESMNDLYNVYTPLIVGIEKLELNINLRGQNALLKFLEEPPSNLTLFILVESVDNLLPTIVGRGAVYYLDNYTTEELKVFSTKEDILSITTIPGEILELNNVDIDMLLDDAVKVITKLEKASYSNAFNINNYITTTKNKGKYTKEIFIKALYLKLRELFLSTKDSSYFIKYTYLNNAIKDTGGSIFFIDNYIINSRMEKK